MDPLWILILLLIGIAALSFWAVFTMREKMLQAKKDQELVSQRMEVFERRVSDEMFKVSQGISQQLGGLQQSFDRRLKDNTDKLDTRLDNAARSFAQVNSLMSQVLESNKHIHELGKDIASLQDILRAPKLRGGLGELFLEDLLGQIFPKQNYALQHAFRSGEKVDAVIRLKGGLISVDSKFPLENFRKMVSAETDQDKKQWRKLFFQDIKKHVDAISEKYILPNEGTLDFALMYIPAENVYYETIIKEGDEKAILQYAFEKKVIPVSPNTFYVYINTILLGLRGMQIEEHAKSIMENLKRLMKEYGRFRQDFDVLGKHITDSKNKFDTADKRLERFENQLDRATEQEAQLLEQERLEEKE